jgi:hypothetical protein
MLHRHRHHLTCFPKFKTAPPAHLACA